MAKKQTSPEMRAYLPSAEEMAAMKGDPVIFFEKVLIRSPHGIVRLGSILAPHQQEWHLAMRDALLSLAVGEIPPVGKYFLEATKGAGKDFSLALMVLWLAMAAKRPIYCQIGAADRDQADELRKSAKLLQTTNPWLYRVEIDKRKITCPDNGFECEIIPADVAGSHGSRPDFLVINELHAIPEDRWEFAENLMDNASKVPNGLVVIATNAGFTGTSAFRWREMARTSERWRFLQYNKPAPWLNTDEVEEARKRNSRQRFMRLFFGRWSSGAGDNLDEEDIQAAITCPGPLSGTESELAKWSFVGGLDLGIKHDHSALVILGVKHGIARIRIAAIKSWRPPAGGRVNLMNVEQSVRDMHATFHMHRLLYDPHQAELLAQRLRRSGIMCEEVSFTGGNLDQMATVMMEVFRSRTIDMWEDKRLIADLGRITIEEKAYGQRLTAVADADGHADTATALAIALPWAQRLTFGGRRMGANDAVSSRVIAPNGKRFVPMTRQPSRQEAKPWILRPVQEGGEVVD